MQQFICLCEHFLNEQSITNLYFENYELITYYTRKNKLRGGTLILAEKGRQVTKIDCRKYSKMDCFEVCGLKDIVSNLHIFCCYQNNTKFDMFLERLELLLQNVFNKKCIICGDFNVNMLEGIDNVNKSKFLSLLCSYNFRHLVNTITFKRNNIESCIDNVLTNLQEESIQNIEVHHNGHSDGHAALLTTIMTECDCEKKWIEQVIFIERRSFSKKNKQKFRKNILEERWSQLGLNSFINTFKKLFNESFRKIKIKINLKKTYTVKWITKGIKESSKFKRVLCTINKGHTHPSVIKYRNTYLRLYRKVMRCARLLTIQSEINEVGNSSKGIWQIVNRHTKNQGVRENKPLILKINNITIHDPKIISEIFSEKFDHGRDIIHQQLGTSLSLLHGNTKRVGKNMHCRFTNENEIGKIVRGMKSKKTSGYDDVPITIIKENIDILAAPLAHFFNLCIQENVFPEQLKIAKILPVHKKNCTTDPHNYRPISLLPTLSKILENILKVRLVSHLNCNQVLHPRQFGFQKGVGTSDAIDTLMDDVIKGLNSKNKVCGVFLDFSAAFDTVNHDLLIAKMEYYGIRNDTLELFKSYLGNRYQYVELKELSDKGIEIAYASRLVKVTRGVPQGSILGPIFFIIFINDLIFYMYNNNPHNHNSYNNNSNYNENFNRDNNNYNSININLVNFADDTNAVITANTIEKLNADVDKTLDRFDTWFRANYLTLNTSKTNILLFKTTARNNDNLIAKLNNEHIGSVNETKFLGVHIDNLLNWKSEVEAVEKSVSSACYALSSLRDVLSTDQLKVVYYSLVESKFRYSITLWGNSYKYNIDKAFMIQKRAIRTMVRAPPWESCRAHFKSLGILTLPSLYILVLLTGLIKRRHIFESDIDMELREKTRRKDLNNILTPTLTVVEHCAHVQAVKLFNKMPIELKTIRNVNTFKQKLRALLLEKCIYNLDEF